MTATASAVPHPLVVRTVALPPPDGDPRSGAYAVPDDLLDLLPREAPLAWVRRGDGLVGWGEAARIEVGGNGLVGEAAERWRALVAHAIVRDEVDLPGTGLVAFGSFPFDELHPDGGVLVVPRVVVGRRGRSTWITTIDTAASLGPAPTLATSGARPPDSPDDDAPSSPGDVTYLPGSHTHDEWRVAVERAVAAIRDGEVDKVVLARDVVAETVEAVDARWLLKRLADRYSTTWTFSVDGLVGATPELLVRSEKGLVISRVLAGTVQRTGDDDADVARAAILARSSKDLEEHEYAVASLADALAPFCSTTNVPETPFVLHLPNVLHLATDVTGVLAQPAPSVLALAEAVHPTAAVCGTPTAGARDLIGRIEGLDRARYAGPVGWIGADGDGEWGIALRCAELSRSDPRTIRLFAGCGVVAASVPEDELAESEAKLAPMRWALGED